MKRILIALVVVGLAGVAPARADDDPVIRCQTANAGAPDPLRRDSYDGGSDRVHALRVAHMDVLVLVPAGYHDNTRRYPTVYLFQGGINHHDCFLGRTDLIGFTEDLPEAQHAIVVMPDVGSGPVWQGMHGRDQAERFFFDTLVPAIDAEFRTIADPRRRALAGFSAGGLGALVLAARNPDAFGAVAGLSAIARMDPTDPGGLAMGIGASALIARRDGVADPFAEFGDPVVAPLAWYEADPVSQSGNFGGLAVHLFAGDGAACDPDDPPPLLDIWPTGFGWGEAQIETWALALSDAMNRSGVEHQLRTSCGYHDYLTLEREIHEWWPEMIASLGGPRPTSFDHRRADPTFSVWDWSFNTDPARAREFLDVAGASCAGLALSGSGLTTVTTARCFTPGTSVLVSDIAHTADAEGRLTFTVDLGPAHEHEQYTPAARALEGADPNYWTTRSVELEELR